MTAAYRLKGLGWFGGCVVVTLGFYLVSLQVASERKRLEQVEVKIRVAQRDIRALETEFDTRANLAQLERWNGDTLALVAPTAAQFVRSEAQLASVRFDGAAGGRAVQTASLVVPAFTPQVAAPTVTPAQPVAQPVTVKVAANDATKPQIVRAALVTGALAKPVVRKAQVAMVDRGLLSSSTLGDLVSGARSESSRLR